MFDRKVGFFLSILFAAVLDGGVPSLAGAPSPTACNPYDGQLQSGTANVVYDKSQFTYQNKHYPFAVFSLANPAPWAPNFICLRYEVENGGNDTIPLLYWDLADQWSAFDLPPRQRLVRVKRQLSVSKDAVRGPTIIKAFRSEEISTSAWQTVEELQKHLKKATLSNSDSFFRFERSAVLDSTAANAIKDGRIPDSFVAVIEPTGDPISTPPPLNDILIAPFGELSALSSIYFSGQARDFKRSSYGVSSYIMIRRKPGIELEVYAPALVATDSITKKSPWGTSADFLQALNSARQPIQRMVEKGDFHTSALLDAKLQRAFIVEHPITIKWDGPDGKGSVCLRSSIYSPFPINIGKEYCSN